MENIIVTFCYKKSIFKNKNTLYKYTGKLGEFMGSYWSTDSIPQYSMLKLNSFNSCNSSDMPWMQNAMPSFTPMGSFGNYTPSAFGWGSLSGGTSSGSSNSAHTSCETLEEYQEMEKKKSRETRSQIRELNIQKQEIDKAKVELKTTTEQLEKGKQEDGTVVVTTPMEEYKKLPWWKRATRALSNMGQGVMNLATKFIGFEDGKWDPVKCLKNVGIAAGAIALCCIPYVGPVIGASLLAGGVVSGGVAVARGIKNLNKAEANKDLQELDNAWQDIGAGTFIGITSACGIKGLGKGFRLKTPEGNPLTNTKAPSLAKTRTGAGKIRQSLSQGSRDIFVNSIKAVKENAKMQKLGMQLTKNNLIRDKYGVAETANASRWVKAKASLKAFGESYKSNIKNTLPALGKKRFDEAKENLANSIQQRIDKIGANPADKLQRQELEFLKTQLRELNNSTTKNQWANAKKSSKSHQEVAKLKEALRKLKADGNVKVNGKKLLKTNTDDVKALESMIKQAEGFAKQMNSLSDLRVKTMRWMAIKPKKNKAELEAYAGSSKTSVGYQWDINKGTITWKTLFKLVWDATLLQFKPWSYISNTPAGTLYKLEQGFLPVYEKNMFVDLFAICGLDVGVSQTLTQEEYAQLSKEYEATRAQLAQNETLVDSKLKELRR